MDNYKSEYQDTYRRCKVCGRIFLDDNCIVEAICQICKIAEKGKETFTVKWNELPDIFE